MYNIYIYIESKKPFDHLEDVLEETEKLIVPNLKK